MKYDFDKYTDRTGTDSVKWSGKAGELPMWVADMDFKTVPEVTHELAKISSYGIYGYTDIGDEWYEAYADWWKRRHGFKLDTARLLFCTGVIPAISSTVRKLTTPNENVVIQTPVYNIFFNCIVNNGARVLESPLIYEDHRYRMDLDDLERKFSNPQTTLFLLCNPQNPTGNIWDRETLAAVGDLAVKYHVTVVADEIHCDLTRPGMDYVPFASVSDNCAKSAVVCMAPSKTFNIAGIQSAAIYVPDEALFFKVRRAINTDEVAEPNIFACRAAVAAYVNGDEWLDELRAYLDENRTLVENYVKENIPGICCIKGDATYLVWLDVEQVSPDGNAFQRFLREKTGLYVCPGSIYGSCGAHFLRMNIACPRFMVEDGLERLRKGVDLYITDK